MPQEMSIQLKREGERPWLYSWRPENGVKFYMINQSKILHPVNEHARNLFNATIAGLIVRVRALYNKETKTLRIMP